MKVKVVSIAIIGMLLSVSSFLSRPSFNGSTPGCSGGSCHTLQDGITTANPLDNFGVEVTLSGVQSGKKVAGELVDSQGNVVDVVDETSSNPFTLTAPGEGEYAVYAGYKSPSRVYDSVKVSFTAADIKPWHSLHKNTTFELHPNHPNPFNNETIINFSMQNAGQITLTIYSVDGKLVRELIHGYYPAGTHSLRWNGTDEYGRHVASGVYLYEIKNATYRIVRRMILSK